MIFRQFHEPSLGHASYLVASEDTGEALVLDARRDVDAYYAFAQARGLRIRYAADTHQHNDYLSGVCELAGRGPLELLASGRAELGYAARPLADGERFRLGEVEFEVLHTPGHTPEHMSLLVRDLARGETPLLLLSGGALLVDDVARPDLLGSAADARRHAATLAATLREKILPLPDHVMVFPTHVAGSLCGASIGSLLFTTVGYERRLNRLLGCAADADDFTRRCLDLDALPTVPAHWPRMRRANSAGPPRLGLAAPPPALDPAAFAAQLDAGALAVDCRSPEAFGGGHVPGAQSIGLGDSFPTWAGTVLPPDTPLVVIVEAPGEVAEVTRQLESVGLAAPAGWLAGGMMAWRTAARPLDFLEHWAVQALAQALDGPAPPRLLDVRQPGEWRQGRLPGAMHVPAGELPARLDELDHSGRVAVYCGSGYRSAIAASLLRRRGHADVVNVLGGFAAWRRAGLPVDGAP